MPGFGHLGWNVVFHYFVDTISEEWPVIVYRDFAYISSKELVGYFIDRWFDNLWFCFFEHIHFVCDFIHLWWFAIESYVEARASIRTRSVCDPTLSSWWGVGRCEPPAGSGAEPRKQKLFWQRLLKIGWKSGLWRHMLVNRESTYFNN